MVLCDFFREFALCAGRFPPQFLCRRRFDQSGRGEGLKSLEVRLGTSESESESLGLIRQVEKARRNPARGPNWERYSISRETAVEAGEKGFRMLMDLIVHTRACHQTNTLELGEMWEIQVVSDLRDSIWRGGATPKHWSAFSASFPLVASYASRCRSLYGRGWRADLGDGPFDTMGSRRR